MKGLTNTASAGARRSGRSPMALIWIRSWGVDLLEQALYLVRCPKRLSVSIALNASNHPGGLGLEWRLAVLPNRFALLREGARTFLQVFTAYPGMDAIVVTMESVLEAGFIQALHRHFLGHAQ